MIGKMGLMGALLFFGVLLAAFSMTYQPVSSDQFQTGTTTMNVTVRGWVSISISSCLTNGIGFGEDKDPGAYGVNASCNVNSGAGNYNLTTGSETTVTVNFTHSSNRTTLLSGSDTIGINNVTWNSATSNSTAALLDNSTATSLANAWIAMENCEGLAKDNNCYATYFLDVPTNTVPGTYITGYCWCGRQVGTAEGNCAACS